MVEEGGLAWPTPDRDGGWASPYLESSIAWPQTNCEGRGSVAQPQSDWVEREGMVWPGTGCTVGRGAGRRGQQGR